MMRIRKKTENRIGIFTKSALICGMLLAVPLFSTACVPQEEEFLHAFQVYYVNNEETGILTREYKTNSTEAEAQVAELLERLGAVSERLEYKAPLAGDFSLLGYTISEGQIILDFNNRYNSQLIITETLNRAALVRTLTQVKGIQYVSITVRSDPLVDSMGNVVGVMTADMFINDAGKEINAYDKIKLRLYFGNESGDGLVGITRSGVIYNSNIAMERVVLETLIAGPLAEENAFATIHPDTKIQSITVKDRICYVNLDDHFLSQLDQVSANTIIYSITNSLVELPHINKVQISVNGASGVQFKENINLSTVFERNLDIVKSN